MIFVALEKQTFTNFEVIIADDGSNNETVSNINEFKKQSSLSIKHIWHEDLGWRKNIILNRAVDSSESPYLIFIDGDCIPHSKFIEEHYKYRMEKRVLAGRRVQLTSEISDSLNVDMIRNNKYLNLHFQLLKAGFKKEERHVENCIRITSPFLRSLLLKDKEKEILGCNFSIHKQDLLLINGFDERFLFPFIGEDTDIEARLRRVGVTPVKKKHILTIFHRKHNRLGPVSRNSIELFEHNNKNNIGWTEYGLIKKTDK